MPPYTRLNPDWNAHPNAPDAEILVAGDTLQLTFELNAFQFPRFASGQRATLHFPQCTRYRLGAPNDEGWYGGQHGFRGAPPPWGEFYELDAIDRADPTDWQAGPAERREGRSRHFLYYLRDATFECRAASWWLEVHPTP